jgi:hypothetical protein
MEIIAEEWRTIAVRPGFEISSYGRVRSVDRFIQDRRGQRRWRKGQLRTIRHNNRGYCQVMLTETGQKPKMFSVHALVAEAFIGPRPDRHDINHKDRDKGNNRPENLEYVTHRENQKHSHRMYVAGVGGRMGAPKLNESQVSEMRRLHVAGVKGRAIAKQFGVSEASASMIVNYKSWHHVA